MSNTLHPEDGIVISKKWVEEKIFTTGNLGLTPTMSQAVIAVLNSVLDHSQPIKPVLEVVTDEVIEIAACHTDCELDKEGTKANANNFLNNPITLKG